MHSTRKAELRALARTLESRDRAAAAAEALRRLVELPEFARARTIAFYAAIADEVPVEQAASAARDRGARTVYPLRSAGGLELALSAAGDSLRPGRFGIREPERDAPRVLVQDIDAFLVPGLLFDRSCRRLGRGGGHYDRLLEHARAGATPIGICYAERVVEELPEDSWDVAMEIVVTDRFVIRRSPREGGA
ncbi:MAG: 5-formyltetrahydrofolate cyclo-ligase [Myxococcota bacterium]